MLISVSIENWMSFQHKATFSMVASRERQHGERITQLPRYSMRVLPIAAIYGGNASGKTNFFKALAFAKRFIVEGTGFEESIPVEPFLLSQNSASEATKFWFELLIDKEIYEYSFSVTWDRVTEERLVLILRTTEKTLFHRIGDTIEWDQSTEGDKFLKFAFQGTRKNQLFLTNAVFQNVKDFLPIFNWFKNNLVLISPNTRFGPFEFYIDDSKPLSKVMGRFLKQLDTGIEHLGLEEIPFDSMHFPEQLLQQIKRDVTEGKTLNILDDSTGRRYSITRTEGKLLAKKLMTFHKTQEGNEAMFEIDQESDGSLRALDLLPAFLGLANKSSPKVYVIDEIDRSLHTLLTRNLLERYLASCSSTNRTQLLFTTHDVLLMDQSLLRRDEMWVAERDAQGSSSLTSFSDYKGVRYDKDLRRSYLQGRLGGVPNISLRRTLYPEVEEED